MKKIEIIIIYSFMFIVLINTVYAATYYVKDPIDCPTTDATYFPGQDCSPNDICGDISDIAQCYDTSLISIPSSYNAGYQSQVSTSLSPGYVLNCYATTTCVDKWYCDYNTTCYSTYYRTTVCNSTTIHSCGSCRSGYYDCDSDGLTCEIHDGDACSIGGVAGTYSGCSGASGNCVVTKSYFETGTLISYLTQATEDAMLWFKNYDSTGWLIRANNSINEQWGINNDSCMVLKDNTVICDSSDISGGIDTNETIRVEQLISYNTNQTTLVCPTDNYVYGYYANGTPKCRSDSGAGESGVDSVTGDSYITVSPNTGNVVLNLVLSNLIANIGNWSADKPNYYNKSEVDSLISGSGSNINGTDVNLTKVVISNEAKIRENNNEGSYTYFENGNMWVVLE